MSFQQVAALPREGFGAARRPCGLAKGDYPARRKQTCAASGQQSLKPHLLDTAFVAGTMGKKAAWQQANRFHNISNDRGGTCG
jgi:hypothetical protein